METLPAFLSFCLFLFFFTSFSLLSELVPTWGPCCSPPMVMIHQIILFPSLCISVFFLSLGSLLPRVAQGLKTQTTAWQLSVKGFVNPGVQLSSGVGSADAWDYSEPLQGLWVLASCRACTSREIWQQLQREYWDPQGRRVRITCSRSPGCVRAEAPAGTKPFLASLFCILEGNSF